RELREIFRENKPMTERLVYRFEVSGVGRERQAELAQEAGRELELESEPEDIEAEKGYMKFIRRRWENGQPRTGDFNPFYIHLGVSKKRQAELSQMLDRELEVGTPNTRASK